jgi:hypothetical protein
MRGRRLGTVLLIGLTACSATGPPPAAPSPAGTSTGASPTSVAPGAGDEVRVTDPESLRAALAAARPGQTITLADGRYPGRPARGNDGDEPGRYLITTSGTAAAPITLRGSRAAVIDGDGPGGGYVLHLVGASHWVLRGFTVSSGSKGIVLDRSSHDVLDDLHVTDIGAEGVHFRDSSSDNTLSTSEVDHTGVKHEGFGEGVYLGSASSNWDRYSGGRPDRSDRNQVLDNHLHDTAAENIDVKEGTSGGIVRGNTLDGDGTAGQNSADSWIDVKGSDYLVERNHGVHTAAPGDPAGCARGREARFCSGFEVHTPIEGAGARNTFRGNRLEVNAPGAGIWLQNTAVERGNVVGCDNEVVGAGAGPYATNHYSPLRCTP